PSCGQFKSQLQAHFGSKRFYFITKVGFEFLGCLSIMNACLPQIRAPLFNRFLQFKHVAPSRLSRVCYGPSASFPSAAEVPTFPVSSTNNTSGAGPNRLQP